MQELAIEVEIHAFVALAIQRITHKRMVNMTHMDANLMCAAGVQVALYKRVALIAARRLKALENPKRCDRLPRKRVVRDGHLHTVTSRTGDTRVDGPLVHNNLAVHQRDVATIERASADEVLQRPLRVVVFGGEHEARGVAVEPMYDARAILALNGAEMVEAAVVRQGVCQRAILMAMRRMAHEPALLGQHEQVIVLVANIEWNGLRHDGPGLANLGELDRDTVPHRDGLLFG